MCLERLATSWNRSKQYSFSSSMKRWNSASLSHFVGGGATKTLPGYIFFPFFCGSHCDECWTKHFGFCVVYSFGIQCEKGLRWRPEQLNLVFAGKTRLRLSEYVFILPSVTCKSRKILGWLEQLTFRSSLWIIPLKTRLTMVGNLQQH